MAQCKKRYAIAICALLWAAIKPCFARQYEDDSPALCRLTGPSCSSNHATLLPSDLWARIFAVLAREVASLLYDGVDEAFYEAFDRQADLHRLRMVCRGFKAIFKAMPLGLTSKSSPSLLSWAREHASSVQLLAGCDRYPDQQHVLQTWIAFSCCHNNLAPVILNFTSLTTCKISTTDAHNLDLTPLGTSSTLQQLELQFGEFTTSALPPHLTHLSVHAAGFTTKASLHVSSLRKLSVYGSHLSMGSSGVFACSALQEFHCHSSCVADRSMVFDTSAYLSNIKLPVDLTPLSDITVLSIEFTKTPEPGLDLDCFSALTTLHSLSVYASHGNVLITPKLTALQQLTSLSVSARVAAVYHGSPGYVAARTGRIEADIQWQYLPRLRKISLEGHVFQFRSNIMALLKVRSLSCITLGQCTFFMPSDYVSSGFFGSLLFHLAKQRPDVCVNLNRRFDCVEP